MAASVKIGIENPVQGLSSDHTGSTTSSPQLPKAITDLMFGFCASQTLFAACELGVFEVLHTAKEPQSSKAISEHLSTDQDAMSRLLDALVCLELLEKQTIAASDTSLYANNSMAEQFLLMSSPGSVRSSMAFGSTVLYQLFGNLNWAVRDGTNQWQRTFNRPSAHDFFKAAYATKEEQIRFLEAMRGTSLSAVPEVISAFDLSQFRCTCDLGGGTGDLAYVACMSYPDMKITVLDLPPVVDCSPHFRPSMDKCPNQHNISFVAADFFKDELPSADLYVLTRILHDWGEEKVDLLLAKVFSSLPSGGGLLIGEILLQDNKTGPFEGVLASLSMLVLCDKGARERSSAEYQQLLEKHGFVDIQFKHTGTTFMDAILCRKP